MDTQPDLNSKETTPLQTNPSLVPSQTKPSIVVPMVLAILASGMIFGFGGYYIGKQSSVSSYTTATLPLTPTVAPSQSPVNPSTSDSVSTWKTYTNERFGFTIKYPPYANTQSREPDPFPVAVQIDNLTPRTGGGGGPEVVGWLVIISEPQQNTDRLSLREWAQSKERSVVNPNLYSQTNIDILDTTVDNHKALTWRSPDAYQYYLIEKNATEVVFIVINKGDISQISDSFFDQLISTLQFTY